MAENDRSLDTKRLERENIRLKSAIEELSILNDIASAIGLTSSLDEIIVLIVKKCIKHLKVEQCTVTLLDSKENDTPFKTMIRRADTSKEVIPYRLDTQLTGWMIKNRQVLLIKDFKSDERFSTMVDAEHPIRSLLSAPLLLKGRLIGSLNVFNKKEEGDFTDEDKRLLSIIAGQSAQVIENARLYEEEQALMLMREEMRLAQSIQMDLLPREAPRIDGYAIAGKTIPAKMVGGDYFDFIKVDDHKLAFCLGDVSGKGMPAALLMANVQATLRGQALDHLPPAECLTRSNSLLFRSTDEYKFVTLFYGILEHTVHSIRYANAGHNPPFLFRASGEILRLGTGGLVLGAVEDYRYEEDGVTMEPGDFLLIFSDGVTEARNADDEEFGEDRLIEVFRSAGEKSTRQIIDSIVDAVYRFSGDRPALDDVTIVGIKRLPL